MPRPVTLQNREFQGAVDRLGLSVHGGAQRALHLKVPSDGLVFTPLTRLPISGIMPATVSLDAVGSPADVGVNDPSVPADSALGRICGTSEQRRQLHAPWRRGSGCGGGLPSMCGSGGKCCSRKGRSPNDTLALSHPRS